MTDGLRSNSFNPANDSETVWVMRKDRDILGHENLHFSSKSDFYLCSREQHKKRFDVEPGPIDVYLGNQKCIRVESNTEVHCDNQSDSMHDELLKRCLKWLSLS